jgi:hypothetical protein
MMEGNFGPPVFTQPLLPSVSFFKDFTSNEKYEESYKFPKINDPDNDGIFLTKVSMGGG